MENDKPRMSNSDPYCTVRTKKTLMAWYVWLWTISVAIFLIAFIFDYISIEYHSVYQLLMIIGASGTLLAMVLWGLDRRCNVYESKQQ